jgi:hypothetical protein
MRTDTLESLVERVREKVAAASEAAVRDAVRQMASGAQDLAEVERRVLIEARQIGQIILAAALETAGNGKTTSHRWCACGLSSRYVSDRPKTLQTLLGPVEIRRAYYHCRNCGRGDFPLDEALGVAATSLTPGVQEVVAWADAELAYGRAVEFLEKTMGLSLSKDTHETLSRTLGRAVEPQETARAAQRWSALPPASQLYVSCDGVKVNTDAGWKEPKLGAVFRAERGRDGAPIRGPTRYVAHVEEAEPFGERLWRLADAAGVEKARTVIVLGDGAPWIWNLADMHFPKAVQIVDFYHAVERLSAVAHALWGDDAPAAKDWLAQGRSALHDGHVGSLLNALRKLAPRRNDLRECVRKAIGYFRQNRYRMRYDHFRAQGYFIGSGVIEAGRKHIVAKRFKQSGMRWSLQGFLNLLHLRLCILNGDWDDFARSRFPKLHSLQATYF